MNAGKMAEILRTLRQKKNLTQEQVAQMLSVSPQTLSRWECGGTLPPTMMLPVLADYFGVTIDDLFGRGVAHGVSDIPEDTKVFLLQTYSQMYAPEAGPWNLSPENKYLEYKFRSFFETNFPLTGDEQLCNIGIGAGEWDTYLSYKVPRGSLTSVDVLELCCRQLEQRLRCEGNPNAVTVLCADARTLDCSEQFDLVTMVGSTGEESGDSLGLLSKVCGFVKPGGAVYYQSLDAWEDCNAVIRTAFENGMDLAAYEKDGAYGFCGQYYKFLKPLNE